MIFAVDSIPAVLAVTRQPYIVFTSNIFAILGLRSLYFALAGLMDVFHLLHYGLADHSGLHWSEDAGGELLRNSNRRMRLASSSRCWQPRSLLSLVTRPARRASKTGGVSAQFDARVNPESRQQRLYCRSEYDVDTERLQKPIFPRAGDTFGFLALKALSPERPQPALPTARNAARKKPLRW